MLDSLGGLVSPTPRGGGKIPLSLLYIPPPLPCPDPIPPFPFPLFFVFSNILLKIRI